MAPFYYAFAIWGVIVGLIVFQSIPNALALFGIGLIIASVVNIFFASDALSWAISVVGVVIFAGLTAYDTQKLRAYATANAPQIGGDVARKVAIFGALNLYLDFINLFLFLLRLLGRRR